MLDKLRVRGRPSAMTRSSEAKKLRTPLAVASWGLSGKTVNQMLSKDGIMLRERTRQISRDDGCCSKAPFFRCL
jgi:hypothetical protein